MFAKFCFFLFLFTVVFLVVGYLFERFVSVWFFLTCLSYKPPALVVGSDNYLQLQSESLRWFQYEQCRNPSAGHHYRQWFVDLFAGSGLKRLKQILEFRGIYLSSEEEEKLQINNRIVDKVAERDTIIRNRLIELINASGHISSDELRKLYELDRHHHNVDKPIFCDNCIDASSEPTPSHSQLVKQFTSSSFIEEEIDYDRTHVWLFYVNNSAASQNSQPEGFDRNVWPQLCQRLSNVGIRFASFDCSIDVDYCHRKGWHSSRLLLFTSVGNIRYSYSLDSNHTGQPTTSSYYSQLELARLIGWIESNLSKQLSTISTERELMSEWLSEDHNHHHQPEDGHLQFSSNPHLVKLIAIMDRKLEHIPSLTLPLLAVRFANSVNEDGGMGDERDIVRSFNIGRHFVDTSKLRQFHLKFQSNIDPRLPIYLIRFGTRTVLYCENLSTSLSYSQMEIFVGGLLPSTGDLYLVSFILVNLCLALNFFWTRCLTVGRYLRLCLSLVVEFNVVLASALLLGPLAMDNFCMLLSLLLPQTWLMSFVHQSTALLKVVWSSSWVAAIFRSQLSIAYHWPFSLQERFLLSFILTGLLIALIRKYFSRIATGFPTNSTTDRSSNFDDQQIENLFRCISIVFCFINFLLFRRSRTISRMHNRRRNYYAVGLSQDGPALLGDSQLASRGHLSPNDGSHNDNSQPNVTQTDLNGTDEHEPDDDNSDNEDDDELIDLDDDLDRMLIESLFRLPNLWLQTELISPDYIRELPLWQYCKPPPLSLSDNPHSEDGFLSSAFSNSSDSSDNDEYSESNNNNNLRDCKSLSSGSSSIDLSPCLDVGSTSSLNSLNQCCSLSNIDSCHQCSDDNCAQTDGNCIKEPAIVEPCSDALPTQLEPNLRVKLEKQKILYVRKRSKNNGSNKSHRNRSRQVDSVVQSKLEEPSNDDGCTDRPKWMINIEECTICLDRYRQGQPICGLPCGHNYHAECIVEWLRRDNHCCPICRWPTYRLRHSIQTKHQNSESTPLTK